MEQLIAVAYSMKWQISIDWKVSSLVCELKIILSVSSLKQVIVILINLNFNIRRVFNGSLIDSTTIFFSKLSVYCRHISLQSLEFQSIPVVYIFKFAFVENNKHVSIRIWNDDNHIDWFLSEYLNNKKKIATRENQSKQIWWLIHQNHWKWLLYIYKFLLSLLYYYTVYL